MVICGVSFRPEVISDLESEGVRDSKELPPNRREELDEFLRVKAEKCEIVEFEACEIDNLRWEGTNLNQIEEIGFSKILNRLKTEKAFIDSASANAEKFSKNLMNMLNHDTELIVEHGADKNRLPASAASIIAKVRRDKRIEELKEEFGDTGSGYPGDNNTIHFLKKWFQKHGCLPECARETWKTAKRIKTESEK